MKVLTIVIHAGAQQSLADSLRALSQVQGFTFTRVEGHAHHADADPFLSARDKVVGYVPRVRLDVLLDDADVNAVLEAALADGNYRGQGVYWVSPVEQHGQL